MWYAKPSGLYATNSTEGIANTWEIYNILDAQGYSLEAICGVGGAIFTESGLNPWRWENDTYNLNGGYGFFQFTPSSDYFNDCSGVTGYAPNMSPSQITAGANVSDAIAQMSVMVNDLLQKWVTYPWRSYWDANVYPTQYQEAMTILQTYGNNNRLTQNDYKLINNVADAAIAFMCCYEGPAVPDFNTYERFAFEIYDTLTGTPPQPPTPIYTGKKRRFPIWMMDGYKIRGRF